MSLPDVGHYADSGLYDGAEGGHFIGLRYACLKNAHLTALAEKPYGKRYAHLRIVGTRRPRHVHCGREQLIKPFFHDCLAVRSSYAYHRQGIFFAMALGQPLQSLERTDHKQEIGSGKEAVGRFGYSADYEIAHAAAIKVGNVLVSVVKARTQRKEKSCFRKDQRTAVREKPVDVGFGCAKTACADEGRYFIY